MSVPLRWQDPEPTEPIVFPTSSKIRKSRSAGRRRLRVFCGSVVALAFGSLAVIGAASLMPDRTSSSLHLLASNAAEARASLVSASSLRRLGFVSVTGSVLSHDRNALPKVEAVVELLDAQNHTVQVESGMVAFDPLPAGVDAPFHIEVTDVPQAVAYRIRFRQLDGVCLN